MSDLDAIADKIAALPGGHDYPWHYLKYVPGVGWIGKNGFVVSKPLSVEDAKHVAAKASNARTRAREAV